MLNSAMAQTQTGPAQSFRSRARPEISQIIHLGWPILITQLSGVGLGVVDTLMAGRAGAQHLAAVGIGSGLWIPLLLFMIGVLYAVVPNVAQLWGANRKEQIAEVVTNGLLLAMLICLPLFFLLRNTEPLL